MWGEEGGGYGNVGTAVERAVGKVSGLVQLKRRKTETKLYTCTVIIIVVAALYGRCNYCVGSIVISVF